jgi:asparagine synthase (glutamine-hydrolysing)
MGDALLCGIAGALDSNEQRSVSRIRRLNALQAHRGPDDDVVERVSPSVVLGNTRLAIQGLGPEGDQPLMSSSGRYACVFNGEIYNYTELRARYRLELESTSDGAVIPELWELLGDKAVSVLRGMFAIAIADRLSGELFLARDPFGIKPLYWRELEPGTKYFASEPRALMQLGAVQLSEASLASFLYLGALPPDASPFDELHAVPPNAIVRLGPERGPEESAAGPPVLSLDENPRSQSMATVLSESVRLHLRSDVPTALLLSSGVDSAAIAKAARDQDATLHCLTVGGEAWADEVPDARQTAAQYGHSHALVPSDLDDKSVAGFIGAMQRPTIDGLNTYLVSAAVRSQGFKVALSGLGADEALGGYSHFRALRFLNLLRRIDRRPILRRALERAMELRKTLSQGGKRARLLTDPAIRNGVAVSLLQREVFPTDAVERMVGRPPTVVGPGFGATWPEDPYQALVAAEAWFYMGSMLLPDADAFSMCSSVELRVPFVDPAVFRSAIAARAVGKKFSKKAILVDDLGDGYISRIAKRPKRGFSVPMERWMTDGALRPLVERLEDDHAAVWGYVDRNVARDLLGRQAVPRWSEIWALAALNAWIEDWSGTPAG